MTQIVYDGQYLYADSNCYGSHGTILTVNKIKTANRNGERWYWAFAGSLLECQFGNAILENNFDPEIIKEAREVLKETDPDDAHYGLLVRVLRDGKKKVYLVSYFGDMQEVIFTGDLIAVGAYHYRIMGYYKLLKEISRLQNTTVNELVCGKDHIVRNQPPQKAVVDWIMKYATKGTDCDLAETDINVVEVV